MLTLPATGRRAHNEARPSYRPYRARVAAVRALSPAFVRVTLASDSFSTFGTAGLDQRIKLLFPHESCGVTEQRLDAVRGLQHLDFDQPDVQDSGSWYERWRALPDAQRNPFRTYTVRAVRSHLGEIDVDVVRHDPLPGETQGPASVWISRVRSGDEVIVIGPDDRSIDWRVGLDWHPGAATQVLLVGDETAAPAICSILESLAPGIRADAFIEVPSAADRTPLHTVAEVNVRWLARDRGPRGELLDLAVRDWWDADGRGLAHTPTRRPSNRDAHLADDDPLHLDDDALLWEVPEQGADAFYAWVAGERSMVRDLRRFLVQGCGVSRGQVAFMGYWRQGAPEAA